MELKESPPAEKAEEETGEDAPEAKVEITEEQRKLERYRNSNTYCNASTYCNSDTYCN